MNIKILMGMSSYFLSTLPQFAIKNRLHQHPDVRQHGIVENLCRSLCIWIIAVQNLFLVCFLWTDDNKGLKRGLQTMEKSQEEGNALPSS